MPYFLVVTYMIYFDIRVVFGGLYLLDVVRCNLYVWILINWSFVCSVCMLNSGQQSSGERVGTYRFLVWSICRQGCRGHNRVSDCKIVNTL